MRPPTSVAQGLAALDGFHGALVQHLEQRYGIQEVREHWYFEIWNESSWMYSLGMAGYNELYDYTVQGLVRGDPNIKVGGPAESGGGSAAGITNLVDYCRKHSRKLDFRDLSHLRTDRRCNRRAFASNMDFPPSDGGHGQAS